MVFALFVYVYFTTDRLRHSRCYTPQSTTSVLTRIATHLTSTLKIITFYKNIVSHKALLHETMAGNPFTAQTLTV